MHGLEALLKQDHFSQHCHLEVLQVKSGSARVRMKVLPCHLNGVGIVHGGAIFTLGDLAAAAAANSRGDTSVIANSSISFLRATKSGTLVAEAEEIASGNRLGSYLIYITDDMGETVAVMQSMSYRKGRAPGSAPPPEAGDGSDVGQAP